MAQSEFADQMVQQQASELEKAFPELFFGLDASQRAEILRAAEEAVLRQAALHSEN